MPAPVRPNKKGKSRATADDAPPEAALPLGKQLAHTDKKIRDRAVASLVAFVSAGSQGAEGSSKAGYLPLDVKEMDKLWKGLFYCFWMSDKPLVQQSLASLLAELLLQIQPADQSDRFDAALGFLRGFWRCIVREWEGVDRLRVDKFYMLMRRYVNATFRLLAREEWREAAVREVNAVLTSEDGPMSPRPQNPISLPMHLSDIFLTELDSVLSTASSDSTTTPCPLPLLLQPYTSLLARTPSQILHKRLMSTLFVPLVDALDLASPSVDRGEPAQKKRKGEREAMDVWAHIVMHSSAGSGKQQDGSDAVKSGVLRSIFEEGSKETAVESNRRRIYQFWRERGGDDEDDE